MGKLCQKNNDRENDGRSWIMPITRNQTALLRNYDTWRNDLDEKKDFSELSQTYSFLKNSNYIVTRGRSSVMEMKDELCPPAKDKLCPPAKDQLCPPAKDQLCPPAKDELCPPAKDKLCPPAKDDLKGVEGKSERGGCKPRPKCQVPFSSTQPESAKIESHQLTQKLGENIQLLKNLVDCPQLPTNVVESPQLPNNSTKSSSKGNPVTKIFSASDIRTPRRVYREAKKSARLIRFEQEQLRAKRQGSDPFVPTLCVQKKSLREAIKGLLSDYVFCALSIVENRVRDLTGFTRWLTNQEDINVTLYSLGRGFYGTLRRVVVFVYEII